MIHGLGFLAQGIILAFLMAGCTKPTGPPPPNGGPDTTSHNFTWQIFELGDGSSSVLYDVAIVNDTLAYAVGEVYLRDSTGQIDPNVYNAARWDGVKWNLTRIPTRIFGTGDFMYAPLRSIFAFGASEMIVTTGGQVVWYDGASWGRWQFLFSSLDDTTFGGINKFWGSSGSSLWGVGNNGNIFFYNGAAWLKVASGTSLNIHDIYASGTEILAIASTYTPTEQARQLLRIDPFTQAVSTVSDSGLNINMTTIWFDPGHVYLCGGDGLFRKADISDDALWQMFPVGNVTTYSTERIRGSSKNDVFAVGSFREIVHFNGNTWVGYRNQIPIGAGAFGGVSLRNNFAVVVGFNGQRALIAVGRR